MKAKTKTHNEESIYIYISIIVLIVLIIVSIYFINLSQINSNEKLNNDNLDSNLVISEDENVVKSQGMDLIEIMDIGNSSNCKYASNKEDKTFCLAAFDICPEGDDNCIYQKARLQRNTLVCEEISDSELSTLCLTEIRENNIVELTLTMDDVNICDNFNDVEKQNGCKDNYYFVTSITLNDSNLCNNILMEEIKNECLSQ